MAAYKTGRSRTLTISGTFSGKAWQDVIDSPLPRLTGNAYTIEVSTDWITDGATKVTGSAHGMGMGCTAVDGLGGSDSDVDKARRKAPNTVVSGNYELSIDVEEWVTPVWETWPILGGSPIPDFPQKLRLVFDERSKIGGAVSATIELHEGESGPSVTATASTMISSSVPINAQYGCAVQLYGMGILNAQYATADWEYLGFEVPSYGKSSGGASISAYENECTVTTDASTNPYGTITVNGEPPQGLNLSGVLRTDAQAWTYGGTVRYKRKAGEDYAEVAPSAGAFSVSYKQQKYAVSGNLNGVSQEVVTMNDQTPTFYCWFVPPSGEDPDEWRMLLRGASYEAMTLAQAATVTLDGGFSFTDSWTDRTFSPAKSMAGYRYLCVQTDQAQKVMSLLIGNKACTVTSDGSGLAIFDLCGPSNLAVDTDARDTRWPTPTAVDTVSGDGCMWGVVDVGLYSLTVEEGLTATVPAGGVYLSRDTWASQPAGHSLVRFLPPFKRWDADGSYNRRGFLYGDTDGRQSLEESDGYELAGSYVQRTIEELVDDVNATDSGVTRNPGWTATINASIDVADGADGDDWLYAWLNRNRPATWLYGAGALYRAGAWSYGLDVNVASAATIHAQLLCDEVQVYPACGDVFGLRAGAEQWEYGTDADPDAGLVELRAAMFLRSPGWGLVLDTGGLAYEGGRVTLKQLPAEVDCGYGDSDIRGEYLTGAPFGRGSFQHRVSAEVGGTFPCIESAWYSRHRPRRCFAVTPGAFGPIECDGARQWLHVGFGARIRTYHLVGYTLAFESDEYANVDEWVRLRYDRRRAALLCLGRESSTTYRVYLSHDGGLSGSEVLSMTARTACIERDSERGMFVLMYENSGNVQRRVSLDGGDTWETATEPTLNGVAITGAILDMTQDTRRGVMLMALTQSGVTKVLESHDIGESWAVAVS